MKSYAFTTHNATLVLTARDPLTAFERFALLTKMPELWEWDGGLDTPMNMKRVLQNNNMLKEEG